MRPASSTDKAARWVTGAVVVASVVLVALVVWTMLERFGFPYELEWMEGGVDEHTRRVLEGKPLYGPPTLEWTPFLYTPFYYQLCAALAWVFGPSLALGRAVSIASTVACMVLVAAFARHETRSRAAGTIAAAMYAGTYFFAVAWYDLARMDSLAVALLLGGIWVAYRTETMRGAALSGLLLFLAFFTKQTMLAVSLPAVVYAWLKLPRRGWAAAVVFAGLVVGTTVAWDAVSDGWYSFYVWTMAREHGMMWHAAGQLWWGNTARVTIAVAWTALACLAVLRDRQDWRRWVLYAGTFSASAVAGFVGVVHEGGGINALMPFFAAVAVIAAVAVHRLRDWRPPAYLVGQLTLGVQIAMLFRDPRPFIPSALDQEIGQRIVAGLAQRPGPVWTPGYRTFARAAGHGEVQAHMMALCDVFKTRQTDVKHALLADINTTLTRHDYDAVLVGPELGLIPRRVKRTLERRYQLTTTVFWPGFGRRYFPRTGYRIKPEKLFTLSPAGPDPTHWVAPSPPAD